MLKHSGSSCARCKLGNFRIPHAVLNCRESCVNVVSKCEEYISTLFYEYNLLREYRQPRSELKNVLQYAEVYFPNSWNHLFGKDKLWLNLQNVKGYSALHYACLYNLPQAVDKLIQAGIDITLQDNEGNQPLHIASSHSNTDIVRTLLKQAGQNCFKKNREKMTALEIAIQKNRVDVVHILISHMCPYMKHHPLCVILNCASEKLLQKLLKEISFDNCFCDAHNLPVLILALINEPHTQTEIFNIRHWFILADRSKKTLAVLLEHIGSLSEESQGLWMKGLVKFKKYKNKHGNSLLHYSCWYNAICMTKHLLEFEADLSPNKDGNTPLHLCCTRGHVEVAKLLLDKGLPVKTRNKANLCPLSCACTKGNLQTVKLLLKHEFHPNSVSEDTKQSVYSIPSPERRFLPINKAISHLPEAVPLLLQYGSCINFGSSVDDMETVPHMILIKSITKNVQSAGIFALLRRLSSSNLKQQEEKSLCHIIRAGALISKGSECMQYIIAFERKICKQNNMELIQLLVESGYRFSIHLEIPEYLQEIQSNPYSLQCITGHTIRTNLRPNAWVGVKDLGLPTAMKKFIVLDSSFVSF